MRQQLTQSALGKLENPELITHTMYFQTLSQQYLKELKKSETKVGKLTERLTKKEAKKKAHCNEFPGGIPSLVLTIAELSTRIRNKFWFGGKEHHFQAALEMELRALGHIVTQEVARLLHYKQENGAIRQLPHDIRGREDLLLPAEKFILELKQTKALGDSEHMQLMRYMRERYEYDAAWGKKTQGMLINFGDENIEVWWMFYDTRSPEENLGNITRVLILKEPLKITLNDYHPQYSALSVEDADAAAAATAAAAWAAAGGCAPSSP
jgi:GxxExxY protein